MNLRSSWNDFPPKQAERNIGTDPLQVSDAQAQTTTRAEKDAQTDEKQQAPAPSSMPGLDGFVSR